MMSGLSLLSAIIMVSVLTSGHVPLMMMMMMMVVVMASLDMEVGGRRDRLETMELGLVLLEMVLMVGRRGQQTSGGHDTP